MISAAVHYVPTPVADITVFPGSLLIRALTGTDKIEKSKISGLSLRIILDFWISCKGVSCFKGQKENHHPELKQMCQWALRNTSTQTPKLSVRGKYFAVTLWISLVTGKFQKVSAKGKMTVFHFHEILI